MPVLNRALLAAGADRLRPYLHHGVNFRPANGSTHAVGDCPFCGREGKFSVEVATGLWRCFVCAAGTVAGGGNGLVFTRLVHSNAVAGRVGNRGAFLASVAQDRKLLSPDTVAAWGIGRAADGTWLVPGYGTDGKLDQVYRRVWMRSNGDTGEHRWRLLPTPGIWPEGKVHALHLPASDFDPARPCVDVCEGPWDGMAAWEVREVLCDRGATNIVAVPGCNTWRDEWTQMCRGKQVRLWFDSDHPREVAAGRSSRAGYDGMARVARRLSGVAQSVRSIRWGPDGYDPTRPSGYDVRDHLSATTILFDGVGQPNAGRQNLEHRRRAMAELLAKVEDAPREWFNPASAMVNGVPHHADSVEAAPCHSWVECLAAWEVAILMRRDLRDATAVLLAVCASTQQGGNQLFLDLIGSPGSAKTTLCQGLLTSGNCVHVENLTKIVSGWKKPDDATADCSFLARANNKTWVTCEFDVMGSSPEYRQLMGKVRRIFDGETSTTYGNDDVDRVYRGLRTPWIRAGTQMMMDRMADYGESSLGDRFLRFIISDPENGERRDIARSAARSERLAMVDRANGTTGSTVDPKTRLAQALTGGYVDWLRANVDEKIAQVDVPAYAEDYCIDLAELSADMRARPNEDKRKVDTHDVREMPTRLARQNIRLAAFLAVALNRHIVDTEVLRIVRKVALDTATGHSLKVVKWLAGMSAHHGKPYQECGGLMLHQLTSWSGMTQERLDKYLKFLCNIDVLQMHTYPQMGNSWTLTDRTYELYKRIRRG